MQRVLHDIEVCRTEALGGHLDVCEACGDSRPSYNSCRNRHCPKCQHQRAVRWVREREARTLETHHFRVVFTLPAQLRAVALRHRRLVLDMLLRCASETLLKLGRDRLHAQLAVTTVLHTWSRDLGWHPHVHCIVSGGGLDVDTDRWVSTTRKFLFPVRVMGALFAGKMLAMLAGASTRGKLDFGTTDPTSFFTQLYRTRWIVYSKAPFGDASHVIRYLGRYTHRVGISNSRIQAVAPQAIRFATRAGKSVTLQPLEFLRRFVMHVLPRAFVKIRHYGLLAPLNVNTRLARARQLLEEHARTKPSLAPQPRRSQKPIRCSAPSTPNYVQHVTCVPSSAARWSSIMRKLCRGIRHDACVRGQFTRLLAPCSRADKTVSCRCVPSVENVFSRRHARPLPRQLSPPLCPIQRPSACHRIALCLPPPLSTPFRPIARGPGNGFVQHRLRKRAATVRW